MTPRETLLSRMGNLNAKDQDFARSLLAARYPTPKQTEWIGRLIEQADPAKTQAPAAQVGDVSGIVAMLDKGATKLKKPRILFTAGDLDLRLSIASERARFPGSIDVTTSNGNDWFGRIHRDGRFEPSRTSQPEAQTAIVAALQAFAADPAKIAAEYGRRMGLCCACGRPLADPVSVYLGYGPVCASRYGWPHRATGLTTDEVQQLADAEATKQAA